MRFMGKARNNLPADLIEFREAKGTRRQLEKLGGGIVEYSKPTRKRRMAQPFQTSTGKFPTARATARDAVSAPSQLYDRFARNAGADVRKMSGRMAEQKQGHLDAMTELETACLHARERAQDATGRAINAIAITNRLLDDLVLVKPKRCICCGALAHEVTHGS